MVHMDTHTDMNTHTRTYTHIHAHTHTHTYPLSLVRFGSSTSSVSRTAARYCSVDRCLNLWGEQAHGARRVCERPCLPVCSSTCLFVCLPVCVNGAARARRVGIVFGGNVCCLSQPVERIPARVAAVCELVTDDLHLPQRFRGRGSALLLKEGGGGNGPSGENRREKERETERAGRERGEGERGGREREVM